MSCIGVRTKVITIMNHFSQISHTNSAKIKLIHSHIVFVYAFSIFIMFFLYPSVYKKSHSKIQFREYDKK